MDPVQLFKQLANIENRFEFNGSEMGGLTEKCRVFNSEYGTKLRLNFQEDPDDSDVNITRMYYSLEVIDETPGPEKEKFKKKKVLALCMLF